MIKNRLTYLLTFSIFLGGLNVNAFKNGLLKDNPKSVLEKIKANYDDLSSLSLNFNYKLYKGFESDSITQEYTSEFCRIEDFSYRKIGNIELMSNSDYSVNVNHEERTIILSNPSKVELMDANIETSLRYCSDIKIVEQDEGLAISLIIGAKTDIPYSVIQLKVDKNFWIQEVVMLYSSQLNFSDDYFTKDMAYPKLVVSYGKLKKKYKDSDNLLSSERYLEITDDLIKPSAWLTGYKILDLRTQN